MAGRQGLGQIGVNQGSDGFRCLQGPDRDGAGGNADGRSPGVDPGSKRVVSSDGSRDVAETIPSSIIELKLIVASGKSAGREFPVKRSPLLIGRAEECHVRPLSEDVSRRHCVIHVGPADAWAEDLGSRTGTFVNGVRIKEKTKLADGDLVRVGALELKVSCAKPAVAGAKGDVSASDPSAPPKPDNAAKRVEAAKASRSAPGILPPPAKTSADSSRDAAAEALRKFFNNR